MNEEQEPNLLGELQVLYEILPIPQTGAKPSLSVGWTSKEQCFER